MLPSDSAHHPTERDRASVSPDELNPLGHRLTLFELEVEPFLKSHQRANHAVGMGLTVEIPEVDVTVSEQVPTLTFVVDCYRRLASLTPLRGRGPALRGMVHKTDDRVEALLRLLHEEREEWATKPNVCVPLMWRFSAVVAMKRCVVCDFTRNGVLDGERKDDLTSERCVVREERHKRSRI